MDTYIAVLRGINVGGHRKIKMEALRGQLGRAGFQDVETYIQSGNLVFRLSESNPRKLASDIQSLIQTKFGHEVPTIVLSADELVKVQSGNPYVKKSVEIDPKSLYVTFLSDEPDRQRAEMIQDIDVGIDEFSIIGKVVYLKINENYRDSKLSNHFFESKLRVSATSRNWNTVNKLCEMAGWTQ